MGHAILELSIGEFKLDFTGLMDFPGIQGINNPWPIKSQLHVQLH